MSDFERNKGRLFLVEETEMKNWANERMITFDNLTNDPYNYGFVQIDGLWYRVEYDIESDYNADPTYAHVNIMSDGTIEFETYHYNGSGTEFDLIEEELKKR